jgi:hypothetical protein
VRISTGVTDGWQTIQITEADPDQRAALDELGHPADVIRRYPPGTRYFERAVANLRQGLVVPVATEPGFGRWGRAFTGGIRVEWLGTPARVQEDPWPLAAAEWSVAIDAFTTGRRGGSRR